MLSGNAHESPNRQLRNGINKVGIPDLIIAQHAIQNNCSLFSLDKHFAFLGRHLPLNLH